VNAKVGIPAARGGDLTQRESEVLLLVAGGHVSSSICSTLHITENTYKTHLKKLRRRLDARTLAHAVALGYQRGILH
jgi:DNA-binding CsgD family transcriptional regulator